MIVFDLAALLPARSSARGAGDAAREQEQPAARRSRTRRRAEWSWSSVLVNAAGAWLRRGSVAGDVVGLHPAGRADRKAGLGARGELARGLACRRGRRRPARRRDRPGRDRPCGHRPWRAGRSRRRCPARARARCADRRSPRRPASGRWSRSAPAPSMTWIRRVAARSRDARGAAARSPRLARPPSSSAWPLSSWKYGLFGCACDQRVDLRDARCATSPWR